jgi:hypothetical protein
MALDIVLTVITLVVAVIGTLLRDPPRKAQAFLIALAVLASLASVVKAINDESDKEFMKAALTSTLVPSSTCYAQFSKDLSKIGKRFGFNADPRFYHNPEGATCFFSSTDGSKRGTLVFDRSDIAKIYANQIARRNNEKDIAEAFDQSYDPKDWEEELRNKVCVLGFGVFFDIYRRSPSEFFYDDDGVRIGFEYNGKRKTVEYDWEELVKLKKTKAVDLFYDLEQGLRKKYEAALLEATN